MEKKPALSKFGLYAYTIGGTIGAGMFITLPYAIQLTGKSVILAILVASFACFFAYFYCLALSSFASVRGGDYGFQAFLSSPLLGGVQGVVNIFYVIGNYVYAEGALVYIGLFVPFIAEHLRVCTVILLIVFSLIDYAGTSFGEKVQSFMTCVLVFSVLCLVVFGLPKVDFSSFLGSAEMPFFAGGFTGFSKAVALCIWVVGSIGTTAITFTREVRRPTRTIPTCIIVVTCFIAILAGLIGVVCAGVVPIEQAVQGVNVVAEAILPRGLFVIFTVGGAAFALLSSLQSFIFGYREGILEFAHRGYAPKFLTRLDKRGYPWIVGILILLLGVIPYLTGLTLDDVVTYTGVPVYVCLVYLSVKCIDLPKKYPELWKKSMLHMPMPCWYLLTGIATVCSVYLVYCYCADFTAPDVAKITVTVLLMFAWSYWRIKGKFVDVEKVDQERDEIIRDALDYANQDTE